MKPKKTNKKNYKKPKPIKLCDVMPKNEKPIYYLSGNAMRKVKKQGTNYKPKGRTTQKKKKLSTY